MSVVSDSSPLILLAKIGELDLLRELYTRIIVPPAVSREVYADFGTRAGAAEVRRAGWIVEQAPVTVGLVRDLREAIDEGEAEAIALAFEIAPRAAVLLDDRRGRLRAAELGLEIIGSAGVVGAAKSIGLVPRTRPLLDRLRAAGLYLGDSAYRQILAAAGE